MAFTAETRRKILDQYFESYTAIQDLHHRQSQDPDSVPPWDLEMRQQRLTQAYQDYAAGLPSMPVSRCPFTNEILTMPWDPFGLDGLWWCYEAPVRGELPRLKTYMALTGAVRLTRPVERAPFLTVPGPGVPFVMPRVLAGGRAKAVVSALPLGRHVAFAVIYYAPQRPAEIAMPNLWGSAAYQYYDAEGEFGWYETYESPGDRDFNLKPWLDSGSLLWIAPADASLTLRSGSAGSPYAAVPGERQEQRIYAGNVEAGNPRAGQEASQ